MPEPPRGTAQRSGQGSKTAAGRQRTLVRAGLEGETAVAPWAHQQASPTPSSCLPRALRKRSAQRRRRVGVSDRRPDGSRRPSARCAAPERGPAPPETHGIAEPQSLFRSNPTKNAISSAPSRRSARAQSHGSGSTTRRRSSATSSAPRPAPYRSRQRRAPYEACVEHGIAPRRSGAPGR